MTVKTIVFKRTLILLTGVAATTPIAEAPLLAQAQCDRSIRAPIATGSDWEHYLRALQIQGLVGAEPWSLRQFSPEQARTLSPNDASLPWPTEIGGRLEYCNRVAVVALPARLHVTYNSATAFGWNDGAVWAGRGLTGAVEAGLSAGLGPLTLTLAPILFAAENREFRLVSNGQTGRRSYADWRNPSAIDLPQRFGDERYGRFDLGQSEARVDVAGLTLGISAANEHWGPATDHPIILGNNAPGFPRVFAGTSRPLTVGRLGSAHTRVFYGKLSESDFSVTTGSNFSRLASGITLTLQPRFLPGLEFGGGRFFHVLQREFALTAKELARPFGLNRSPMDDPENQLASVFARLVLPADNAEVYAEFGREDHNWDKKEFWQFLDHDSAYLLGGQKAWRAGEAMYAIRAEVLNSRTTHLALSSNQVPMYTHHLVQQGHTNHGQALGSAGAYGGGASLLRFDRYLNSGLTSLSWERLQVSDGRTSANPPTLSKSNVVHAWRVRRRAIGPGLNLDWSFAAVYQSARQELGRDVFAFQMTAGVTSLMP